MLGERELAGESGQHVPAGSEDDVVGADCQHVRRKLAYEQRQAKERWRSKSEDGGNAPPVHESAHAARQPSRHSCTNVRTRELSKSRPGPSAFTWPRLRR